MFIQKSVTVLANTTNDNVIAGDQFEFAPSRCIVEFGLEASAIGMEYDVLIGSRAVVTRYIPPIDNRNAKYPDEFYLKAGARAGERIIIRARNTTGGNLNTFNGVKFTPV